jgi:capsular polysaccharide biosynthesis protein
MPEEEIELIDLIRVVWKRRWLIIGGTLACALTALVVSLYWPKTYEGSVILEVGKIYTTQPERVELIEDPKNLEPLLKSDAVVGQLKDRIGSEKDTESLRRDIKIDTKSNPLVLISLRLRDPKAIMNGLNFLAEWIINDHKKKEAIAANTLDNNAAATVEKMKKLSDKIRENGQKGTEIQRKIKNIDSQIATERQQIDTDNAYQKTVEDQIKALTAATNDSRKRMSGLDVNKASPLEILFLQTTIQNQELRLAESRREINDLKQRVDDRQKEVAERQKQSADFRIQILDLDAQNADLGSQIENLKQSVSMLENLKASSENTKYRTQPVVLEKPVSPRKGLNTIIAGILGLMMTVILAFFLEYISQEKMSGLLTGRSK